MKTSDYGIPGDNPGYIFDEKTMKELMSADYLKKTQYGFKESPELVNFRKGLMQQEMKKRITKSVNVQRNINAYQTIDNIDKKM